MSIENPTLVERVAWALIVELHKSVPEIARPISWDDLSHEQERRMLCAAAIAVRSAQEPKWPNARALTRDRRSLRASAVTAAVMVAIAQSVPPDANMAKIAADVMSALYLEGVEIITEHDRIEAGLSPRGPDGLTKEELIIMDARLTLAMLAPLPALIVQAKPVI